jgi:hypothetical protein
MIYTVRLLLDTCRKDGARESLWDVYRAVITIRAVSQSHALNKALAKAPETFRTVYYRAAMPETWSMYTTAEIVERGTV